MHTMLNVVTGPPGEPQAVLLRAAEAVSDGLGRMNGPAMLTRELGVRLDHNGADLVGGPLRVARGEPARRIEVGPRIGVAYAGAWADAPLRFVDAASGDLSRKPAVVASGRRTRGKPEHRAGSATAG
jgi:DNA-3-methyladenine glycosylase